MSVATTPRLRPLGIAQLLDQTIRIYRRNFLKFIGIMAIVLIPIALLQLGASLLTFSDYFSQFQNTGGMPLNPFAMFTPSYFFGMAGNCLLNLVSFVLIYGIIAAVIARTIAGDYLGESIGVIEAYRKIGNNWGWLIITFVLIFFLLIGLMIGSVLVPCIGWIPGPGLTAFVALVLTPLIAPAIVLEKHPNPLLGIRRAWDLARRRFWWVLGFAFILTLFGQLIIAGPVLLTSFLFQVLVGNPFETGFATAFTWQIVTQTLVGSILLYFDLRVRTEALDLALLAENTPGGQVTVEDMAAQAPPPEQGNLITMTEVGYFCLISIGVIAIFAILVMIGMVYGFAVMAARGGPGF
jgi:hypothetical protein